MEPTDITIEILKEIRDEVKEVRNEVRQTNTRVDATNSRLDHLREDVSDRIDTLTRRVVESEIRTATAIASLAGSVQEMTQVLRATNELRPRVDRCELDIAELKRRLP